MDIAEALTILDLEDSSVKNLASYAKDDKNRHPVNLLGHLAGIWGLQVSSLNFALTMDSVDKLKHFRSKFSIPKKGKLPRVQMDLVRPEEDAIYMCSNSLGLKPEKVDEYMNELLDMWANWGVLFQFEGRFAGRDIDLPPRGAMERMVGGLPYEVALMNGLTVNLHCALIHFYRPSRERFKILIESQAFPSDMYAVKSHLSMHGIKDEEGLVLLRPRANEQTLRKEDILDLIERNGDEIALILLPGVQYYTGQYFDIPTITRAGHEKGCIVGWDLAHSVGNVELHLHEWDVDFAVWCTYKYMCGGQGAIGGFFLHEKHWGRDAPRLDGWWGTRDDVRFRMEAQIHPAPGADSFRISNPPAWIVVTVLAALEVFDQTNMREMTKKQFWLTGYLELLLKYINEELKGKRKETRSRDPITLVTPSDPRERGCMISVAMDGCGAEEVHEELLKRGVVTDMRVPEVIRVAPFPLYNTFEDVWNFVQMLRDVILLFSS